MMDMALFVYLVFLPCVGVALAVAAMYWWYPKPLIRGYVRYADYLIAGLKKKQLKTANFTFAYSERSPVTEPKDSLEEGSKQGANSTKTPVVLFLHGYSASRMMWFGMVRYLPTNWRILLLDLPGHGGTSFKPRAGYCVLGMVNKIHEFVTSLGLDETPFHLVGTSLGGLFSGSYAAIHPELIQSLTLICPPGMHRLPEGQRTPFFKQLEETRENLLLPESADDLHKMLDTVLFNPQPFKFHRRMSETMLDTMQKPKYPHFKEIQDDLMADDKGNDPELIIEKMAGISCKTLILWGDHDNICHLSGAYLFKKHIKRSEVVVLEKCGHCVVMDRPRKSAMLLQEFVDSNNENKDGSKTKNHSDVTATGPEESTPLTHTCASNACATGAGRCDIDISGKGSSIATTTGTDVHVGDGVGSISIPLLVPDPVLNSDLESESDPGLAFTASYTCAGGNNHTYPSHAPSFSNRIQLTS